MRFQGLFNSADATKYLKFTYMAAMTLLLSAVVLTPVFIRSHLLLLKRYVIEENTVEAVLIGILLLLAYVLSDIYKKELKKLRKETRRLIRDNRDLSDKLDDAFKYIGGVNIEIQQIRSIFCGLRRYPATENEFKKELTLFARKILGIVNADWVMLRIICQRNLRTMKEHHESRTNANFICKGISNKAIVANRTIEGYSIVTSNHDNSIIMGVCVFPKKSLTGEEKILVEAITNQIEMLYLIYISHQSLEIYPDCSAITRD
jgi:DNA gyrase/topoisomerase IV subunit A